MMNFLFYTDNIHTEKYEEAMIEFLYSHISKENLKFAESFFAWTINIFPNTAESYDYNNSELIANTHSISVKHKHVDIFLTDINSNTVFKHNLYDISIELAKLVLYVFYPDTFKGEINEHSVREIILPKFFYSKRIGKQKVKVVNILHLLP